MTREVSDQIGVAVTSGELKPPASALSVPHVTIIMLTWKSYEVTRDCLLSLRSLDYRNFEVLLVDNASGDGSPEKLAAEFPEVKLIRNAENLGFPGGNNVGIREALKESTRYLLLLNNDTIVAPDFLSQMVRVAETDPSIGVVNPKIYFFEPSDRLWCAGGCYTPWWSLSRARGVHERDVGKYDRTEEISFATGCAFLIKTEVVRRIGLLDETFFLGFEDLDWSLRVAQAGYKIYYVPTSVIWHKDSYDTKKNHGKPVKDFYSTRNRILFARKHMRARYWPLFALSLGSYMLYRSGGYLLRGEPKRITALFKGVAAGISTKICSEGQVR
jgi:GT2 family glycosyltransferase